VAYTKQSWSNGEEGGTPLSAARLSHIEDGIEAAATTADSAVQPGDLADVATTGSYSDLDDKPSIPDSPGDIGAATAAQGALADSAVQPEDLGTAALVDTGTTEGTVPLLNSSGRLDIARLASGTPDGTKYVRDDGTLAVPSGGGGIPSSIDIAAATDKVTSATINDDGSSTSSWPNRWEWLFKPNGGSASLVQWVNEYGELRLTPAKSNTVGLRIFGKTGSGGTAHSGPVLEVQDNRTDRNSMWSVDADGNMATADVTAAGDITATGTVSGSNIGVMVQVIPNGGTPDPIPGSVVVELDA
jgi:hypothetical protein